MHFCGGGYFPCFTNNVSAAQIYSCVPSPADGGAASKNTVGHLQFSTPLPIEFVTPTADEWELQLVSAVGDSSTDEVVVTIGIQPMKGQQGAGFRLMQVVGEDGEVLPPDLCWNHGSISRSLTAGVFTLYTLQPIRVPKTMPSLKVLKFKLSNIEGYEARGIPIHWSGSSSGTPDSPTSTYASFDATASGELGHGGEDALVDIPSARIDPLKSIPVLIEVEEEERIGQVEPPVVEDWKLQKPTVQPPIYSEKDQSVSSPPEEEPESESQSDDETSDEDHLLPAAPFELIGYYCGGKSGCPGRLLIYLGQDGHMERLYKEKQPYYGYVAVGGVYEGTTVTYAPDPLLPMPITEIYKKGDCTVIECASFGALWNDESGRSMGTDENGNCENGLFRFILSMGDEKITVEDTEFYNDKTHHWVKFVPNNGAGSIDLIGFDMRGFVLDHRTDLVPIDWYDLEKSMIAFDARLRKKGRFYKGLDMKKATSNLRYHNIIR